jgi:1-deoxy-D-xylulose-5-phosphate reductoisomerase
LKKLKIGILGSTGSIGCNSLEVINNLIKNGIDIEIAFLTTNTQIELLNDQVELFNPKFVFINNEKESKKYIDNFINKNTKVIHQYSDLLQIIRENDYEILINSLVGFAGLHPTIVALKSGKKVALANKESMVVAGKLINSLIKKHNSRLLPIDSEHSAILQCLEGEKDNEVNKVYLTASGGPFRNFSREELRTVNIEQALNHPNWKMGRKITIDSATLMNKGLEIIEARWLFDFTPEMIEVLIHPQSVIHSMIEFSDGSIKAQLGVPDMKVPIQYALTYPSRVKSDFQKMDFSLYDKLTFEKPDFDKFECLTLAYESLNNEGTYTIVLNAANEIAVNLFLKDKIGFLDIPKIIRNSLEKHKSVNNFELEDIIEIDKITRLDILQDY